MLSNCCSCCCCCHRDKYELEYERSQQIDKELERERRAMKRQVKLLLLGAGESGKSTFLKQMRIIHDVPFSEADLLEFQQTVYLNVVQGMRVLCDARSKFGIPWEDDSNACCSDLLLSTAPSSLDQFKFMQLVAPIRKLWSDSSIKQAYDKRSHFQLSDSVKWFLDEIERIACKDYVTSRKDILLLRKSTKGIHQLHISINSIPFTFYDIGGQRSQRAKWVQCFESSRLSGLIFMVAANEWDQFLVEDRLQNRLIESQSVFSLLINNRVFEQVAFILFLNKYDLLTQKLGSNPQSLATHFPEFGGDASNVKSVQEFILSLFVNVNRVRKEIYYHWTTAVDTDQIRIIFNAVKAAILKRNLGQLMLE